MINAVKTVKPIMKGEEYFASYGYSLATGPKWYRELYIKSFSNSTNANDDNTEAIKSIESSEDFLLENGGNVRPGASSSNNEF